ncbi:hypothetical protein ACWGH5_36855 [Streptomyces sp. NPDC054864]
MKRAERPSEYAAVRFRNQTATVAAALCAALALSACGSSDDDSGKKAPGVKSPASKSSAPSTTPSPSTDPETAEKKAVLEAYARMWAENVKAYAKADPKGTKLSTYSAAVAWAQWKNDLKSLKKQGIVTTGEPSHDIEVTGIKPDKKVPSAELTDCLDTTDWKFVYRKSGKPVAMPNNRLKSYVMEITAEKWGKQWKVVVAKPLDRAC